MGLDRKVLVRISQDDRTAYSEAYRYLYPKLFNYGKKFSFNQQIVEDAIQETLLLLWNNRKTLLKVVHIDTYYYGVFRNTLLNKIKSDSRTIATDFFKDELMFSPEAVFIEQEINEELRKKLNIAINSLTSRQREAIFLRFYEQMSYEDVSALLCITVKATYKIIARALTHLKEIIVLILIVLTTFFCS